jgi:hypothetical protein
MCRSTRPCPLHRSRQRPRPRPRTAPTRSTQATRATRWRAMTTPSCGSSRTSCRDSSSRARRRAGVRHASPSLLTTRAMACRSALEKGDTVSDADLRDIILNFLVRWRRRRRQQRRRRTLPTLRRWTDRGTGHHRVPAVVDVLRGRQAPRGRGAHRAGAARFAARGRSVLRPLGAAACRRSCPSWAARTPPTRAPAACATWRPWRLRRCGARRACVACATTTAVCDCDGAGCIRPCRWTSSTPSRAVRSERSALEAAAVLQLTRGDPVGSRLACCCADTLPDGTCIPAGCAVVYHPYTMVRRRGPEPLWHASVAPCAGPPLGAVDRPHDVRPRYFCAAAFRALPLH